MLSDDEEVKLLIEAGKIVGAKAMEENFGLNLPFVFLEGDCIVELWKDGRKKIIKKLNDQNTKSD